MPENDFPLEVKTLDRVSFVKLFEYILSRGIRKVYFSSRSEKKNPKVKWSLDPRVDFTITGLKHMIFPYQGKNLDIKMSPGEAHYAPPMTWKQPEWDELHRMASIVYTSHYIRFTFIDYSVWDEYYSLHGAKIFYHSSCPISTPGKAVILALSNLAEEPCPDNQIAVELMSALLRLSLANLQHDREKTFDKRTLTFARVDNYLRENFLHNISRQSIAKEFRLSPTYISSLYAGLGNGNFHDTLLRLRMEHATVLLKNTTLTIDEITDACAYSSTTYFIAAFKKIYGIPPGRYRRKYANITNKK